MDHEPPTEPAPNLQAHASLRRHAMAAAARFAAQAQVKIDDEALELIAEFVIAVTLTVGQDSVSPLPDAVVAAGRLLFLRDELKVARAEVRKEGRVDEQDARERAEKTVASFFAVVERGANLGEGDLTLKPINSFLIWRGKVDHAFAMGRLVAAWRKRRRRERQVAEALRALDLQGPPNIE
jgi:hypothetical protein